MREIVPKLAQTYPTLPANLASFRIWQRDCHTFEDVAIIESGTMILTGHGDATEIPGARASANLLDVLGVQPALGRMFLPQEDNPGNDHVVLLSYGFWSQRFNGDRKVVGQAIMLDGATYQVIGILPASFRFPKGDQLGSLTEFPPQIDYVKPLGLDAAQCSPFGDFDFAAIARLKPGVSAAHALAELNVVQAQIARSRNQGMDLCARLIPLEMRVVGCSIVHCRPSHALVGFRGDAARPTDDCRGQHCRPRHCGLSVLLPRAPRGASRSHSSAEIRVRIIHVRERSLWK